MSVLLWPHFYRWYENKEVTNVRVCGIACESIKYFQYEYIINGTNQPALITADGKGALIVYCVNILVTCGLVTSSNIVLMMKMRLL
jgi:hypothetical protein